MFQLILREKSPNDENAVNRKIIIIEMDFWEE